MKKTGETPLSIEEKTVPVAQTTASAVAGSANETDLWTITASSTQLVPATEQAYLTARRSNDQLTLVAPKTGAPMLQYPLIDVNRGNKDILASGGDLSARVGRALSRWFTSGAGVEAIAAANCAAPTAQRCPTTSASAAPGAPHGRRRRPPTTPFASGACWRSPPASSRSSTCPAR